MPRVNRIFRLRSTVRSDEMKAESTLSSCAAGLWSRRAYWLAYPALNVLYGPASRAEHMQARTCSRARQTVYETNSARSAVLQTGGLRTESRPTPVPAALTRWTGRTQRQGVRFHWLFTLAKYQRTTAECRRKGGYDAQ